MSNIKKHSLLILMAMLIILILPVSFASDASENINATLQINGVDADEMGIDDADNVREDLSADNFDAIGVTVGSSGNEDESDSSSLHLLKRDASQTSFESLSGLDNVNSPSLDYYGIIYVDAKGNDNNTGSYSSPVATVAKAIELASDKNNAEHKIVLGDGTYKEHDLNISSDLDIAGEGNAVIDAQGLGRILNITSAVNVNISGITFKNGKSDNGGAIYIKDAKVIVDNVKFENNNGSSWGSAIFWDANDGRLTNSVFENNTGRNGAVVLGYYSWSAGKSTGENTEVENCTFNNNHNVAWGNCIGLDVSGSNVIVKNTNFTNNIGEAYSGHGALYIKGDDVVVDGCLFENDMMGNGPAAIQTEGKNTVIKNSRFINNTAISSGAIEVRNVANITGNTFTANGGKKCSGGAIKVYYTSKGGNIIISDNDFIENNASSGAAIYVDGGLDNRARFNSLTIENNNFDSNNAEKGAGIYVSNSNKPIYIKNNDFTGNSANQGSAIYADYDTTVNIESNTMSDNEGNGDIYSNYAEIEMNLTLTFNASSKTYAFSTINITASLTDDMGNSVSGFEVTFTANGAEIGSADLVDGVVAIEFSPENIEYLISGSVDANSNIVNTTIYPALIEINIPEKSGFTGNEITVPVTVKLNGADVDSSNVSVTFNNKTFDADVIKGTANVNLTLPDNAGKYSLTVSYKGKEQIQYITVSEPIPEIVYISNPSADGLSAVDYANNLLITVDIDYNESSLSQASLESLNSGNMLMFINGAQTRVSISGVNSSSKSFTVGLNDYADNLVDGANNITFHPDINLLKSVFGTKNIFEFNNLTVNYRAVPVHNYVYESSPNETFVDYVFGDSKVILVTINSEDLSSFTDIGRNFVCAWINGEDVNSRYLINGVSGTDSSFTFDLANISNKLKQGENTVTFHISPDYIEEITWSTDYKFNALTVNARFAEVSGPFYNTTIVPNQISEYVNGTSQTITVVASFNKTKASGFGYRPMYIYINGVEVQVADVYANSTEFTIDLADYAQYLAEGQNNISIHPQLQALKTVFQTNNESLFELDDLNVNVISPGTVIKYISTPTVDGNNSVEYVINNHTDVLITVNCELLDKFESYDKLYAWIGNNYNEINTMANEAFATIDLKDLSDKFRFEEGQTYTIYFHPDIETLNEIGIDEDEWVFNSLTVETIGTYYPEPTLVYTSTPKVGENTTIDYELGNDTFVTVNVVYNESFTNNEGFKDKNMRMFINGDAVGTVIGGVKANATLFTVNLADYITEEGNYIITFSPGASVLSWVFYEVDNHIIELNNLTVKAVNTTTSEPVYVTTPSPRSIEYTKGESCEIAVTVIGDAISDFAGGAMYMYIDGSSSGVEIEGVDSDAESFTVDLKDYDSNFVAGKTYSIIFRPATGMFDYGGSPKLDECEFNSVTVISKEKSSENDSTYITTPVPNKTEYILGESLEITVNVEYEDYFNDSLSFLSMFVYINGEETENRVLVGGVKANETSFVFDLAAISDKLVDDENILTFHPHIGGLEGTVVGPYTFNALTVIVVDAPEPVAETTNYTTTPVPDVANYTIGDSLEITVNVDYDSTFGEALGELPIYVYINGGEGIDTGEKANATSFKFNLKSISSKLSAGINNISFGIDSNELVNVTTFNNLTLNVKEKLYEYIVTPNPSVVSYTKGKSLNITYTVEYDDLNLKNSKFQVFFDGSFFYKEELDDIDTNAKTFTIDLKDFDDYFRDGENHTIIIRHSYNVLFDNNDLGVLDCKFNVLTVNVTGTFVPEIKYETTPNETSIEYVKGTSKLISVITDCDNLDDAFSDCELYAYINGSDEEISLDGIMADTTPAIIDLKLLDKYLKAGKTYTVVFHPHTYLFGVMWAPSLDNARFNPLIVTVKASEPIEGTTNYTTTPSVSSIDYIIGENSVISVNVDYDDAYAYVLGELPVYIFINDGEAIDTGIKANSTSFEFDLKSIADKLEDGINEIFFGVEDRVFINMTVFNKLVVNATNASEPIVETTNYTTSPVPNETNYTIGESLNITVNTVYNSIFSDDLAVVPIYVHINGGEGIDTGVKANVKSFKFDLANISDKLDTGVNEIYFGIGDSELVDSAIFNRLVVNATPKTVKTSYTTTPTPDKVYYTLNESSIVTVTAAFDEYFKQDMALYKMYVYVNGEELSNRVEIRGIRANETTFTFDLKVISDRLVEGQNNLTFHPHIDALEKTINGSYIFNNLTVIVGSGQEPVNPSYMGIIYVDINGNDTNDGSEDSPVATIAKAIELASGENNTEHKIVIRQGTYAENDLNITSSLEIIGNDAAIDAQGLGRIFNINTTDSVNISGIAFKNGYADEGGAIYIKDAKVTIDNAEFENNVATWGASILWDANDGKLINTIFENNTGRNGVVALGVYYWSMKKYSGANTEIENCTFNNNHNVVYGNCIGLDVSGSNVTVRNTNFTNNIGEAGSEHGALYIKGDEVVVEGCLFENNSMGMASAIQIDGENALIKNSTFINNTAIHGLFTRSGAIEIQNAATIIANTFIANGGDECRQGGAVDIVYNEFGGDIIISDNVFINNTAIYGAAIYVDGGLEDDCLFDSLTIENNIFDSNEAYCGAGVYTATSETPIDILDNEFTNNIANGGSAIFAEYTTVNLERNIMANNEGDGDIYSYGSQIVTDLTLIFKAPSETYVDNVINITAGLTDDMGNSISGYAVEFTVNGKEIGSAFLVDGVAAVEFTPSEAIEYTISGSSNSSSKVVPTAINPVLNATIYIPEISSMAGNKVVVPVTIKENGKDVNNKTVSVTFNGKTFDVVVANGTANVTIILPNNAGNYNITVSYKGKEQSKTVTVSSKKVSFITIVSIDANSVTGVLKDGDGKTIANANVKYLISGTAANVITEDDGTFTIEVPFDSAVQIIFEGNNDTLSYNTSITLKGIAPARVATIINAKNYSTYAIDYYAGERGNYFKLQLIDTMGNMLANKTVLIGFNGVVYNRTTDEYGYATVQINLKDKNRVTFAVSFLGDEEHNATMSVYLITINKKPIKISAAAKTFKSTAKTKKYTVTLKTSKCSSIDGKTYLKSGKKVTLKIKGKTYKASTNSKGQATFKISLSKKGKYKATVKFAGDTTYNAASKKTTITIK